MIFLFEKRKNQTFQFQIRKKLLDIYRDDIFALEKLLKKDMSFWLEM